MFEIRFLECQPAGQTLLVMCQSLLKTVSPVFFYCTNRRGHFRRVYAFVGTCIIRIFNFGQREYGFQKLKSEVE